MLVCMTYLLFHCVVILHVLLQCEHGCCSLLPVLLLQLHAILAIASAAAGLANFPFLQQPWLVTMHVWCLLHPLDHLWPHAL